MKGRNNSRQVKQVRKQPRKDSKSKRINFDNERVTKYDKDMDSDYDKGGKPTETKRTSKSNDVSWYASSPELLKAAASIPFNDVTGVPFPFNNQLSVPGIFRLAWVPYVGTQSSPINQAANQIYSDTVHANSRNQSYDATDEMMLILAGAQVFSALAMGIRAYGIMRRYNQQDRYTPEALITALGFDFSDLKQNLANMWFDLNQLISQTRQIWIPNVMPLIQRWFWMNSNIYRDGASIKSQYYMYVQAVFYQYNETANPNGGSLQPYQWLTDNGAVQKWSYYVDMVKALINSLIDSQDRGIIFGDILKAYGADKLYAIPEIGSDYTVEPIYDREVLSQIENATTFSSVPSHIMAILQDANTNRIYQQFCWITATSTSIPANGYGAFPKDIFINFHQLENPTPEQIMVATRLTTSGMTWVGSYTSGQIVCPYAAGTEVVIGCTYYYYNINSTSQALTLNNTGYGSMLIPSGTSLANNSMFYFTAFDWAPGYYVVNRPEITDFKTSGKIMYSEAVQKIMDYDNFSHIDVTTLMKMHTTAVYSEFGVSNRLV